MRTYANNDDLREKVRGMIDCENNQKSIAARFDISGVYLSDFLCGRREAGPKILAALGYDPVPFYKRKSEK